MPPLCWPAPASGSVPNSRSSQASIVWFEDCSVDSPEVSLFLVLKLVGAQLFPFLIVLLLLRPSRSVHPIHLSRPPRACVSGLQLLSDALWVHHLTLLCIISLPQSCFHPVWDESDRVRHVLCVQLSKTLQGQPGRFVSEQWSRSGVLS